MQSGSLRHRVTLQRPVHATEDDGESFVKYWEDVAPLFAAIAPLAGRELLVARQTLSDVTHRITIRYRPDVRANWRFKYGERYLYLDGPPINPEERNISLVCNTVERQEVT